jgi:membrane carboxypeptidase/penicillin-binding protein PbpC
LRLKVAPIDKVTEPVTLAVMVLVTLSVTCRASYSVSKIVSNSAINIACNSASKIASNVGSKSANNSGSNGTKTMLNADKSPRFHFFTPFYDNGAFDQALAVRMMTLLSSSR